MDKSVLNSQPAGLRDWTIQRLSAIYMVLYTVFIVTCIFALPSSYKVWHNMFAHFGLVIINSLAVICVIWHTWIGMWTIITDYIKPPLLRSMSKIIVLLVLFACFLWGFEIFWHIHAVGILS